MFYDFYDRSVNSSATIGNLDLQSTQVLVSVVLVTVCLVSVLAGLIVGPLPLRVAKVLTILALATYPLYLMHQELGNRAILKMTELGATPLVAVATVFILCVAISILVSMKVEPPLRRAILNRGLDRN
jgi:peptidoglycan/LPS O-acetylase OafA/YrhL